MKTKLLRQSVSIIVLMLTSLAAGCSESVTLERYGKKVIINDSGIQSRVSKDRDGVIRTVFLRFDINGVYARANLIRKEDFLEHLQISLKPYSDPTYVPRTRPESANPPPFVYKEEEVVDGFRVISEWPAPKSAATAYFLIPLNPNFDKYRLTCASNFVHYQEGRGGNCTVDTVLHDFLWVSYLIPFAHLKDFERYVTTVDAMLKEHVKKLPG